MANPPQLLGLRQVPKEEFFNQVGKENVHPRIVSDRWPYRSNWEDQRTREIKGVSQHNGKYGTQEETHYYLPAVTSDKG